MSTFSFFRNVFAVVFLNIAIVNAVLAQIGSDTSGRLTVTAQLRPRAELRQGAFRPLAVGEKPAFLTSQRTRITLSYQYNNILSLQLSPQNVSVWGQETNTQGAGANNGLAFFEAWARLNVGAHSALQIGRQVISLDDERFFGALDWAQGARTHDAVAFLFQKNKWEWRAHAAFNQNYKELYGGNLSNVSGSLFSPKNAANYKWMQNLWWKYSPDKQNSFSVLVNNVGFQQAGSSADNAAPAYFTQTIGANYFYTSSQSKYHFSAYYQTGKDQQKMRINAYLLSASAERTLGRQWRLGLGGDLLSGNDADASLPNTDHAFVPYFGTNHKFYGSMDYYYSGNGHKNTGLGDAYIKARYQPEGRWSFALAGHQFISPASLKKDATELSTNLGQEVDLDWSYNIHPYLGLAGGYSVYAVTPSARFLKGITSSNSLQHWAWCTLNVNAEILKLKF